MTPFHLQLRDARRQRGMTQAELARQAGCTQSALSMFESGQSAALSADTLKKVSKILGVPYKEEARPCGAPQGLPQAKSFCPNFQCPSAFPYFVGGELLLRPAFFNAARHCPDCGELLLAECPHCGDSPAENPGACCAACGRPLVLATLPPKVSPREWARERRAEIKAWREFS